MWAQNLFSITLFLTGFMLGSLSSEKRSYSEVKVRKYFMNKYVMLVKEGCIEGMACQLPSS